MNLSLGKIFDPKGSKSPFFFQYNLELMFQNGTCKLCGKRAKLLRKSHVVPNFMYNGLFTDNHMVLVDIKDPNNNPRKYQTGFFDKYILCEECDTVKISQWERYAAGLLYEGVNDSIDITKTKAGPGAEIMYIKGGSYSRMKLFVISMLWRAHISPNPFFKEINIPLHEKALRTMMLKNNPGLETQYTVAMVGVKNHSGNSFALFPNPGVTKIGGGEVAFFFINSMFYFIRIVENSDFKLFNTFQLKESNEVKIPLLSGVLAKTFLQSFALPEEMANFFLNDFGIPSV